MNQPVSENYTDGTWMLVTFEIPDDITPATSRVLRALPNPYYDVLPDEITILPDADNDDHVSVTLDESGDIVVTGVDTFPGWDAATKSAITAMLHRLWFVQDARLDPITSAETVFGEAVLARATEVTVPVEGSVAEMTVPVKLMVETEGIPLAKVSDDDLGAVAELTAYDVTAELVVILAGLRVHNYNA